MREYSIQLQNNLIFYTNIYYINQGLQMNIYTIKNNIKGGVIL